MSGTVLRTKLVLADAAAAMDFYRDVLGAEERARFMHQGRVVFAEMRVLGAAITFKDADDHDPVPASGPILDVLCDDPDALARSLLDAGAEVVFPMADQPFGGRWGRVRDPYGVQWLVQSESEKSAAEIQAMLDA